MHLRFPNDPSPFAARLALALMLALAATLFGCGGGQTPTNTDDTEEVDPEEAARIVKKQREQEYKDKLKRLKANARQNASNFDQRLRNVRALKSQFPNKAGELDKIMEDTRKEMVEHADKLLADELNKVNRLVEAGDFPSAEDSLATFFESVQRQGLTSFDQTPAFAKWQQKNDEIELLKGAEGETDSVIQRARLARNRQEYALAVAILDAYPDDYKNTKYYPQVEEALVESYRLYKESKKEKEKKKAVPWVQIPFDEYMSAWDAPDGSYEVSDGEITVENSASNPIALIAIDGDNWVEFNLRFELKVSDGVVNMGLRKRFDGAGFGTRRFELDESDEWIPILVTIEGVDYSITRSDTFDVLKEGRFTYKWPKGGFMFRVDPGEKLSLRKVEYQLVSAEEEEDEDDEDEEEDDS